MPLLGVCGWPVAHSRSPVMQEAALAAAGLEGWRYLKLPLPPELFAETVRALPAAGFRGVNVTIPHKEAALAVTRLIRDPMSEAELWHPADCVGEIGAAAGPLAVTLAATACAKGYAAATRILCHLSNDSAERSAAFFSYGMLQ